MSDTKFTPGPWDVESTTVYKLNSDGVNHFWFNAQATKAGASTDEQKANAHLIAAAPAMYDQLESIILMIESLPEDCLGCVEATNDEQGWFIKNQVLHDISRVLAKARGES